MKLNFIPESYRRAVVRAAYLAAFEQQGYRYVLSACGELARSVVNGTDLVPKVILQAYPNPEPKEPALVLPISDRPFIIVILRLTTAVTRYLAVLLPTTDSWNVPIEIAAQHKLCQLGLSKNNSALTVTFSPDPVDVLESFRFPAVKTPVGDVSAA